MKITKVDYYYDANGNMITRTVGTNTYYLEYDAENRLKEVSGDLSDSFVFDGDGNRVQATIGGTTITFSGNYYEWSVRTATLCYGVYTERQRSRCVRSLNAPFSLIRASISSEPAFYSPHT